jgi:hypothetical protein
MKMHATSPCVNAQGSHEARQHGPRSLQMPAARPMRLVCVGVKIGRKVALQFDGDLPRHRRPFLVLDIKPEPQPQAEPARPTATYGDVEVVDLGSDYDPQPSPDTVDTLDGQPEPATEPEALRPTDLDAPVPYLPTTLGAYALGLERLILGDDEEDEDDEDEDAPLDDGEDDLTDEPIGYALGFEPDPDYIAHCIEEEEGGWLCDGKRCDEDDADERETEEEYWARVALDDLRDLGMSSGKLDDRDL